MPRPKSLKPAYCHHKKSGRAFVQLNGKFIYLGAYDTQKSRDAYDKVIGEWIAAGRQLPPNPNAPTSSFTVAMLIERFWRWAKTFYVEQVLNPDGTPHEDASGAPVTPPAGELDNYRLALRALNRLYGSRPAAEFGPLKLKTLMAEMAKLGWSRNGVNRQMKRVKAIFAWGVSEELIPGSVHHALLAVKGYRKGKSPARESEPVRPVADAFVEAVLDHLSPQVKAMIQIQRLTGTRAVEPQAHQISNWRPGSSLINSITGELPEMHKKTGI